MTECQLHQDGSSRLGIYTLRCAHYGDRYVHERWSPSRQVRWMNLVWETAEQMPVLIHVGLDGDDDLWDSLVMRMMHEQIASPA